VFLKFPEGFKHGSQPSNIDLNAVKLCFQVFTEGDEPRKFTRGLKPVTSNTIYDKSETSTLFKKWWCESNIIKIAEANTDLQIIRLSDVSCSVAGGKEIILLCEKVAKGMSAKSLFASGI
jgi:c-Rel proto-oncogene protein